MQVAGVELTRDQFLVLLEQAPVVPDRPRGPLEAPCRVYAATVIFDLNIECHSMRAVDQFAARLPR